MRFGVVFYKNEYYRTLRQGLSKGGKISAIYKVFKKLYFKEIAYTHGPFI